MPRLTLDNKYTMMVTKVDTHKQLVGVPDPYIYKVACVDNDGMSYSFEARMESPEQTFFVPGKKANFYCFFCTKFTDVIKPFYGDMTAQKPNEQAAAPAPTLGVPVLQSIAQPHSNPCREDLSVVSMKFAKDIMCARISAGLIEGSMEDFTLMFSEAEKIKEQLEKMRDELPHV